MWSEREFDSIAGPQLVQTDEPLTDRALLAPCEAGRELERVSGAEWVHRQQSPRASPQLVSGDDRVGILDQGTQPPERGREDRVREGRLPMAPINRRQALDWRAPPDRQVPFTGQLLGEGVGPPFGQNHGNER